jgi:hypothetical protein
MIPYSPKQLRQNVKAGSWVLSAEDLVEVDRISGKSRFSARPIQQLTGTVGGVTADFGH